MTTLADMLDPADRARLDAIAHPPGAGELAEAAREAAAASDGTGRIAWLCVTVALTSSDSPGEARAELGRMLEDGRLKATTLACLAALCGDGDKTTETT